MSRYVAIFPIHGNPPEQRLHRAALNQLADLVPDTVTITGPWTGHTWTDPDHRHWYVMTAPAEGTTDEAALETIRATAHHIDPQLTAWIDGTVKPRPTRHAPHNATRPHLEQLQGLLASGTAVEDAYRACGWARARSAANAARRAGNLTLARTLEAAA